MNISDASASPNRMGALNIFQSPQDKLKTAMKVDGFNEQILAGKKKNAETQKQEFMQILVTQLQNQNPLEPLNDKDFIAQMAQLSSLEKLEDINEGMTSLSHNTENGALFNLIGKRVTYVDATGQENMGTVDSIDLREGKGFVSIDGKLTDTRDITKIQQGILALGESQNKTIQSLRSQQ
jgi:flagellar basal-body rod modification protein FlgD